MHDLGRLGTSNSILDKRGPLGAGEWERVRLQPHLTYRMLHRSAALAPLGAIAADHRERLDGSGYPRRASGTAISHGHSVARCRHGPAGLTEREIEVLRLLARGLSNKEIARQLVISRKTAGKHIEHIYAKIDSSSRAAASLFAVQHGLLPKPPTEQVPGRSVIACPASTRRRGADRERRRADRPDTPAV